MPQRTTLNTQELTFVENMRVARLATTDRHGVSHLVPICYAFDGTRFYSVLDEKPKRVPGKQLLRVRNIEANPFATVLIDQYSDDWSQLGYIQFHCLAELIGPEHIWHAKALQLLRARYQQYHTMKLETQMVIVLSPQYLVSWGPALQTG